MIRNLKSILLSGLFITLASVSLQADDIKEYRSVIGSGGMVGQATNGGEYTVSGIVGQTAIEIRQADAYTLSQGFWVDNGEDPTSVPGDELSSTNKVTNYPNPFNGRTTVNYELPGSAFVTVKIYDVVGNLVKTLVSDYQAAGRQDLVWDGTDGNNTLLGAGSYLCELTVSPAQNAGSESFQAYTTRNVMVIVR